MKVSALFTATLAVVATIIFSGCVESSSGTTFSRSEALQAAEIYEGTVTDVREGKIEGNQSGVGALSGAAMGAAAGSGIGGGTGNVMATVAGAIVGGIAGNAVEKGVTGSKAIQITVELDTGKKIAIVQETDTMFVVGQRVRVHYTPSTGKSRVQAL